jgi:hypothetical protein
MNQYDARYGIQYEIGHRRTMRHFLAIALAVTWLAVTWLAVAAAAEERSGTPMNVPADAKERLNVRNAGELDQTCLRWSDGCVACNRVGGCNNIGIACQPKPVIQCLERAPASDTKGDPDQPRR